MDRWSTWRIRRWRALLLVMLVSVFAGAMSVLPAVSAQSQILTTRQRTPEPNNPVGKPAHETNKLGPSGPSSTKSRTGTAASRKSVGKGEVNLERSRVYVHVDKTGLGHEHAVMGRLRSGRIDLDSAADAGELVFDMTSFVADRQEARRYLGLSGTTNADTQRQVTANMLSADVLDVHRFPTATFHIKKARKLGRRSRRGLPEYELDGDFTLHGTTHPIQVVADVEAKAGWIHLRGSFAILQTRYGITPYTKMFGALGVADRLQIWGDLWVAGEHAAGRKPSAALR